MTEHLPECPYEPPVDTWCICNLLRSCERRLIEWVNDTIVGRIFDLEACQKDDDCRTLARGADLVLSDVLYDYPSLVRRHE